MGYQDSVNGTALSEAYLDEEAKQSVVNYASAAARDADAALVAAKREGMVAFDLNANTLTVSRDATAGNWSTIGPVHGALTTWTPTVTQSGSVAITVSNASYTRTGRWIEGSFRVAVTGTGTAANIIFIAGIPASAATSYGDGPIGTVFLYDASVPTYYPAFLYLASATTMAMRDSGASGNSSILGSQIMTAAITAGDVIVGTFAYEAASDA